MDDFAFAFAAAGGAGAGLSLGLGFGLGPGAARRARTLSPEGSPREPAFVASSRSRASGGGGGGSPIMAAAAAALSSPPAPPASSSPPPPSSLLSAAAAPHSPSYALEAPPPGAASSPLSPSSGLAPAQAAPLRGIAARDVSKVEKAILPLVPTSEAPWLVFVLAAPHAHVYSVCAACLVRLADESKVEVEALERLRPFRALVAAATRFADSRLVVDKAFKVLRRCANMGRPETADARRDAIVRAGALEACALAFATHGRDSKAVTDNVCGLLQGLAMGDEERKEALAGRTALLKELVAAVRTHQGLDSAKSALWNIAVGSAARRALVVRAGGQAALANRPSGAEKAAAEVV